MAGLSGGRAGWASWLARELVPASTGEPPTETTRPHRPSPRDPADEWVDIRARHAPLLPAQVTSTLLERLYPQDEELRRDLTLLSPALDSRSAHALWAELRPPVSAQEATVRMSRVLDEVDADHWRQDRWRWPICDPVGAPHSPGPEVPFVGDRALRALLIAELAHTSSVERWQRIHERLRAAYLAHRPVPDGVRPTIAYLHHTLALADVETVVRALHARLHDTDPAVWLAAVNVICAAPTPPPGLAAAHPEWERQRSQDDLHAAVHDLVTVTGPLP